jgi:serine/threonine-protein kinase HipA
MTTDFRSVQSADVYKAGHLAATLSRKDGGVEFAYEEAYDSAPIATTLPLGRPPRFTPAGSVPPFFAGLLPEGRRFASLQRVLKTSADDELSLLLAVGTDTIGDIVVVPRDTPPDAAEPLVVVATSFSEIRFSDLLADAGVIDAVGLPGVQEKVSARVISVPVATAGDRYILKLSTPEYPFVVENEAYFLGLARRARIPAAEARIVRDHDGTAGLLVRRFDRRGTTADIIESIACEDACQVLDRWPGDKYHVSSEELTSAVSAVCAAPLVAIRDIFRQFCFAWITGNGDVHAKNISVLRHGGEWRVSPAYDLPSTVFYNDFSMALSIDGATEGLSRRNWLAFASAIGLPPNAADRVISELLAATEPLLDEIRRGALPFDTRTTRDAIRNLKDRRRLLSA